MRYRFGKAIAADKADAKQALLDAGYSREAVERAIARADAKDRSRKITTVVRDRAEQIVKGLTPEQFRKAAELMFVEPEVEHPLADEFIRSEKARRALERERAKQAAKDRESLGKLEDLL